MGIEVQLLMGYLLCSIAEQYIIISSIKLAASHAA
jgi:hypothetical protein